MPACIKIPPTEESLRAEEHCSAGRTRETVQMPLALGLSDPETVARKRKWCMTALYVVLASVPVLFIGAWNWKKRSEDTPGFTERCSCGMEWRKQTQGAGLRKPDPPCGIYTLRRSFGWRKLPRCGPPEAVKWLARGRTIGFLHQFQNVV